MKMKKSVFLFSCLFAAALLLTTADAFAAKISFMAGDVKVVRGGKEMKAQFQMQLETGDTVKTGKMAFADISYDNGTVIKVKENSSVTIGNKSVEGSDSVSITGGSLSAKFAKISKGSSRKVYTPTTVCAVRGTEFEIAVSDSADSKIQLSEGAIQLLSPYGVTSMKEGQNAEAEVGKKPDLAKKEDLDSWKEKNEKQLDKDPEEQSDAFSDYLKKFEKRNNDSQKKISAYESKQGTISSSSQSKLEKDNAEIEDLQELVEDDMYLNAAANNSIDGILNRYQSDRKAMYDKFQQIKEESNKVREQQQRNYEAINAVREAYKKAYEEIKQKHKDAVDKIKGSIDLDQYKTKKEKPEK